MCRTMSASYVTVRLRADTAERCLAHQPCRWPPAQPPLGLVFGLRDKHVEPAEASRSPPRALLSADGFPSGCKPGRRRRGRRTRPRTASRRRSETCPTGVVFTSRSQLFGATGNAAAVPPASCATSLALPRFLPYTVTTLPADASATATARAAPPAPRIAARAPRRSRRPFSGARNPLTSVLRASQRSASRRYVLTAPTFLLSSSVSSARSNRSTLYGIVMLTPCTPSAVAKIVKSSALDATIGTYTASAPAARNAALCIAGDTECVSGDPTTP